MKRLTIGLALVVLFGVGVVVAVRQMTKNANSVVPAYRTIEIEPVFSKLITRKEDDRVYSGQIKSKAGVAEFEKTCAIDIDTSKIDFDKRMLVFGITDDISTRAVQFLRQEKIRTYVLDYADTGIEYKLRMPRKGNKHSYLQIFVLDRIDNISHVAVKNLIRNGLSKTYE